MNASDVLAQRLVGSRDFKGKWRLVDFWAAHRRRGVRKVGGGTLSLDLQAPYEHMVWLRREEEAELWGLRTLLRSGDTFVDCGANIGLWTLSAAELVGPGGAVVALEPHPTTFRRLREHVATLPHANVRSVNKAADSAARTVRFDLACEHNRARVGEGKGEVEAAPLDAIVDYADGIKIDVEGYELEVLKGATRLFERYAPWVCIEFNTDFVASGRLGDWGAHQFLVDRGYAARSFPEADELDDDWRLESGYVNVLYVSGGARR